MRIKRGQQKNRKHKELLARAKGFRGSYGRLYRRTREGLMHAGQYSFAHRHRRPSQMRKQWIKIIAAALYSTNIGYNSFVNKLQTKGVELDRKVLAEIAQTNPEHFQALIKQVS